MEDLIENVETINCNVNCLNIEKDIALDELMDCFDDMDASFKEELKQIGYNCSELIKVNESDKYFDVELYKELTHLLESIFKVYISTEDLEGFLSVNPKKMKKHDKIYLTNFNEFEITIYAIIGRINKIFTMKSIAYSTYVPVVEIKEKLHNSINSLDYFIRYFKIVHEKKIEK